MPFSSKYRKRLRARLAAEQDHCCCYCGRAFTERGQTRATLEHRKAKMDGGRDIVANLKAACLHCNQHRGRQMNQARQKARAQLASLPAPV